MFNYVISSYTVKLRLPLMSSYFFGYYIRVANTNQL